MGTGPRTNILAYTFTMECFNLLGKLQWKFANLSPGLELLICHEISQYFYFDLSYSLVPH